MRRRDFVGAAIGGVPAALAARADWCECATAPAQAAAAPQRPLGARAFEAAGSKVRVTNIKVFGVSLTPESDRPYVFVKLETNEGLVGWGEAPLEGKAAAVIACVNDFRDFLIGADP